jgi:hypothetical protein
MIGREKPDESFRSVRRIFILLGFLGVLSLVVLGHPLFIAGYEWVGGRGHIILASGGKAYLSYLLIGIVLTGYNLESTYRTASSHARQRLRLPFLGFFALLGFLTYLLTTGLLYSELDTKKLLASTVPIILANSLIAYGYLRGSLVDAAAPVSRSIGYSSFTAFAAGLYVLAVGAVAQLSYLTNWSPDEVVTISLVFLAILLAVLLLVSNRFQRRVRRFIDRNFYVNRYDYRAQWSHVTHTLGRAHGREEVLEEASALLTDVFLADRITIASLDRSTGTIRPSLGKGVDKPEAVLHEEDPLHKILFQEPCSHMQRIRIGWIPRQARSWRPWWMERNSWVWWDWSAATRTIHSLSKTSPSSTALSLMSRKR